MFAPPSSADGLTLYGSSDDLVQIAGAFREEYPVLATPARVTFDTGTVVSIEYGAGGIWKITLVESSGTETLDVCDEETDGRYTDYLVVPGATSVSLAPGMLSP